MNNAFFTTIKSTASRVSKTVVEHSPEIFMTIGVVGSVAAAVYACNATLKAPKILDDSKEMLNDIRIAHATIPDEEYSETDYRRDLVIAYGRTSWEFVKLYGPSIALGMFSLGCIFASNNILKTRNAELAATCASIDMAYRKYRKNVIAKYGADVDKEMRLGLKSEKVDVIQEDGTVKKEKVLTADPINDYTLIFGPEETNEATKSACYNKAYLTNIQNTMTDLLRSRYRSPEHPGYLYWEEVLPQLGFDPREERKTYTKDGQKRKSRTCHHVGWIYDPDNQELYGDGYVDFRLEKAYNKRANDGYEPAYIIDPNIDGYIDEYVSYGINAFVPDED